MSLLSLVKKTIQRFFKRSLKLKKLDDAYRSNDFYFYEKKQQLNLKPNAITITRRPDKKHN